MEHLLGVFVQCLYTSAITSHMTNHLYEEFSQHLLEFACHFLAHILHFDKSEGFLLALFDHRSLKGPKNAFLRSDLGIKIAAYFALAGKVPAAQTLVKTLDEDDDTGSEAQIEEIDTDDPDSPEEKDLNKAIDFDSDLDTQSDSSKNIAANDAALLFGGDSTVDSTGLSGWED